MTEKQYLSQAMLVCSVIPTDVCATLVANIFAFGGTFCYTHFPPNYSQLR